MEKLEYVNSKLEAHKNLGTNSNLNILEVAKLLDEKKFLENRKSSESSLFFSYSQAS